MEKTMKKLLDAVGLDEEVIRNYIREQEKEDLRQAEQQQVGL